MAREKDGNGSGGENDESTERLGSFPGYEDAQRAFEAYFDQLRKQAELWNAAWAGMVSGELGPGELIRATARSVDSYYSFARDLLRAPLRSSVQPPPWVRLDWRREKIPPRADIGFDFDLDGDLAPSRFMRLGAEGFFDPPVVSLIDGRRVSVEVPEGCEPPAPGQYLSFVFPPGSTTAGPLLIVLLKVPDDFAGA